MQYLKDLEKIININSHTKNKNGVDKVSLQISSWLKELDFEETIYKKDKIGNHLHYKSKRKDGKKILLLGHLDTVFPKGTFEKFKEDERWVYGPGVCDMKGGIIVALQSLRNIYKTQKKIYNIDMLLVSDEETGSDDSKHLTTKLSKNYDYCFVFEAAGANLELVTSRKGVGTFFINIEGKASHAGNNYDKGCDANLEASFKLQELVKLTNLKKGTTLNVGKIDGGIGANTISPHCELTLEFRYKNLEEKQRVLKKIDEITRKSFVKGTNSILSGDIQREVMQEDNKQLKLIKKLEKVTGTKIFTESRGGVSDANIIASCGLITIDGFGPFGDGDHTKKERALKSSFKQRIDFTTKILEYFQSKEP